MKKLLCTVLLCAALNSHAQVFWTETFSNSCTSGCLANSYAGPNGAWTVTSTGVNTSSSNKWFVSGAECGNNAGQCGTACGAADASLHMGADILSIVDPGAAYYAGVASNWRAESPTINCTGKSNITVSFNYIQEAQPGSDFTAIAYYDGTTWYYYDVPVQGWTTTFLAFPITPNASCAPQGLWTAASVTLPVSANNNPAVKIGFRWVNDNDGAGNDPSFAVDDINISSAAAPACSASINPNFPPILCNGDCNSSLSATASGVGPITYLWSTTPSQTTPTATNLCAGTYTVTITDSTGCTATASITITQPPPLNVAIFGNNFNGWGEPCNGDCLDTLTIAVSGGTLPYAFLWSNGCFTQSCPNLCAGTYTVTVADANGCTASASYAVTEPPLLIMGAPVITNPSCAGCPNGSICLGPHSGGTPSYTYSLTPNAGNFNGNCWLNLPAGVYTVCITDANGCTICITDTLVDPPSGIADNFSSGEIILSPDIISTSAVLIVPFEQEFLFAIYDCFGKKVREIISTGKETVIEKGNLSPGIYFFELRTTQRRFYGGKFIVE